MGDMSGTHYGGSSSAELAGISARDHNSFVEARSVAQLIASRLDSDDPWRLALVQRHVVWDEVRISHLLDSLLAGYPIGSLLVCRVRQGGHVLVEAADGRRITRTADQGTWQLLDGQQRVNALVAMFTDRGRFGRFYLNMTVRRIPEDVVTRRRDTRRALDYIEWRAEDTSGSEPIEHRERYVDLSRMQVWASGLPSDGISNCLARIASDPGSATAILNEIDDAFADELKPIELEIAADRLTRLLRAWSDASIPVQHFTVDSPLDVLQVFSRINLAGVRLDGEDVFFAAVKTQWPDAEENLDRVAAASPLLNRMTSLRILARLASRARSGEDLLPLRVDRLNGPKGELLIKTMEALAADASPVMVRLGVLGRLLTTESSVGHGLRLIDDKLLDHVFGWAAVNVKAEDETYVRAQLPMIDSYLVGAHAFRYPAVFLEGFLRMAFEEAVAAGAAGEPFPLLRVVAGARRRWPGLKRGQQWAPPIETDKEKRTLVDQNAGLFLSILQRLPYDLPLRDLTQPHRGKREVEWDHIYPQARANKMRVPGPSGRPIHHQYRRLVWSAGNLWALDRPINNAASDRSPSAKFKMLAALPDAHLPSRWPSPESASLTDSERQDLLAAEELIAASDVETAMVRFRSYVVARGLRMYREVVEQLPLIERFALLSGMDVDAFDDPPRVDLRPSLGVDLAAAEVDEVVLTSEAAATAPGRLASVLETADRVGLADELRAILTTSTELGLVPRPYSTSVMIAPPANRTRMLFTVWPQSGRDGSRFSIYRWAPAIAEFFPSINEETARDTLGPDGFGVLLPGDVGMFLARLRILFGPLAAAGAIAPTDWDVIADGIDAPGAGASPSRTRYWAMRTDPNKRVELWGEIRAGRLRQGWGWEPEMDLQLVADLVAHHQPLSKSQDQAWDNRRMLTSRADAVHVGDMILVPHIPETKRFSLLRVAAPYEFDGGQAFGDYGHILPVQQLTGETGIGYTDAAVPLKLQTSLGNRVRLWNLDAFGPDLEALAAQGLRAAE
jgi:hypothetical protein